MVRAICKYIATLHLISRRALLVYAFFGLRSLAVSMYVRSLNNFIACIDIASRLNYAQYSAMDKVVTWHSMLYAYTRNDICIQCVAVAKSIAHGEAETPHNLSSNIHDCILLEISGCDCKKTTSALTSRHSLIDRLTSCKINSRFFDRSYAAFGFKQRVGSDHDRTRSD